MLTPRYASPEQKRGEGPSVPADIYSLGRLLEEMLPPAAMRSDLRYILDRAMAEHPADRYLSVHDLLEDLRRLRERLPLRARPATAAYVARRFLRRNWAVASLTALLVTSLAGGWWRAEQASRRASAAAAEARHQHQAAVASEQRALEHQARADFNFEHAASNAAHLEALVGDLINDSDADSAEMSLRRAAATLQTLPGPPHLRELSVAWRRVAMILVHRGEFTAAERPLQQARSAAAELLRAQPTSASRRNALVVKLCELQLARQRGATKTGYRLAHGAMADFRALPAAMQAELNGTVLLENARLAMVRELIDQNRPESVPALLTEVVRNSHSRKLTQTRNLTVANLVWSFRRVNRPEDARYWCGVAREWQVADLRISRFCAEPLTAFTERDALFPVASGVLSNEELQSILSRINQLVVDLHEDPRSFPLNIALGRTYARLAEHYVVTGQTDLARPAVSQAAAIRSKLVASDSSSPVVLNFQRRVDTLEKSLNAP